MSTSPSAYPDPFRAPSKTQELVELNHRHLAIAEYILANPSARLREVADALGMSPSWISIVTSSQLFKDYFLRRHEEVYNSFHISIQEKLEGVAHVAIEKLGRAIDKSTDPDFILAAADKTLKHMGFGGKGPAVQINQTNVTQTSNHVSATVIAEARARILEVAEAQRLKGGNQSGPKLPPAQGVQTSEGGYVGAAPTPALIHSASEAEGAPRLGSPVREEGSRSPGRGPAAAASEESLD